MDSVVPYVDILEAQAYFDDVRMNAEAWYNSNSDQQLKALKNATLMIDRLNFKGAKVNVSQVREFPRIAGRRRSEHVVYLVPVEIPDDIKIACCELALTLLDGVDPDLEEEDLGSITEAYATVRVTSDPTIRKDHVKAGIPSTQAWKHLVPYLNDPMELHVTRG